MELKKKKLKQTNRDVLELESWCALCDLFVRVCTCACARALLIKRATTGRYSHWPLEATFLPRNISPRGHMGLCSPPEQNTQNRRSSRVEQMTALSIINTAVWISASALWGGVRRPTPRHQVYISEPAGASRRPWVALGEAPGSRRSPHLPAAAAGWAAF